MRTTKVLLFIMVLFSPLLVSAYPGEAPWDPLYFERVEGPLDSHNRQRNTNKQTQNRLKSWYGITNYYDCYNSLCTGDMSNPSTMSRCLISVEYCLERKQVQDERARECNSRPGYHWNNGICITRDQGCKNKYGQYSYYTGKDFVCDCISGYEWQGDTCVAKQVPKNVGRIITEEVDPNQVCKNDYGPYSVYTGEIADNGSYMCSCQSGYEWNTNMTACIDMRPADNTDKQEENTDIQVDKILSKRLAGKLLLQVEQGGAIWYVDTEEYSRYNVTWDNALSLFRKLSLGITNNDLSQIPIANSQKTGNWSLRNRLKGRLLLQAEQTGAIWYIDQGGYRHSVTWNNLMPLFESLALGITNQDLYKIPVGNLN